MNEQNEIHAETERCISLYEKGFYEEFRGGLVQRPITNVQEAYIGFSWAYNKIGMYQPESYIEGLVDERLMPRLQRYISTFRKEQ